MLQLPGPLSYKIKLCLYFKLILYLMQQQSV